METYKKLNLFVKSKIDDTVYQVDFSAALFFASIFPDIDKLIRKFFSSTC